MEDRLGALTEVELKPGGSAIPVTSSNVVEYVHRVADFRLNRQMAGAVSAFLRGFFDLVKPGWVSAFNEWELQALISGRETGEGGLDVADMRAHTVYAGGYHDEGHPVIQAFWRVVASLTPAQQRGLLKFATGCSRPPLLGFAHLEPPLCVAMAGGVLEDAGTERLPTSSACINTLKLPPYGGPSPEQAERRMRDKLLYSIESKAGFDLS
ncbi:ubiquitin-protein ligase E3 C [Monoraphidium neglectum]|uniref:HECT-type E3 ubiquitin transferase n=1 Tax=Monoraphidium neglectum TaxID=145388 RepID=A0A0D2MBZ1_9CHLO|nr:ubiquitin-protein ligase E3 C [Monoraphidium neglectum]KIY98366.1 ubiquitin-protein ligase E3 C [Monoraphidium neglectum]|eukprot:XP_013897386.1 ubiquitin-protein ligase E3 C [Monoraphidium neglectum]